MLVASSLLPAVQVSVVTLSGGAAASSVSLVNVTVAVCMSLTVAVAGGLHLIPTSAAVMLIASAGENVHVPVPPHPLNVNQPAPPVIVATVTPRLPLVAAAVVGDA